MKVRRPKFDLAKKLTHHYFKNNVFSTHLANSLHIIFPEGEKFFIKSCRRFLKDIKDEQLKKEVMAFMGQEGTHAAAHQDFWKHLEEQGFDVASYANFVDHSISNYVIPAIYKLLGDKKGDEFSLSLTAGLEHYTAILAEFAFLNEDEFEYMPEEMQHLWFWHAAEEIEHKAVAFDLLQYINPDKKLKNAGFALATTLLFTYAIIGQIYFTAQDKESHAKDWLTEFPDFIKSLGRPMARHFYKHAFTYFKSDFHPNELNNDFWAEDYFAKHERYATTK